MQQGLTPAGNKALGEAYRVGSSRSSHPHLPWLSKTQEQRIQADANHLLNDPACQRSAELLEAVLLARCAVEGLPLSDFELLYTYEKVCPNAEGRVLVMSDANRLPEGKGGHLTIHKRKDQHNVDFYHLE